MIYGWSCTHTSVTESVFAGVHLNSHASVLPATLARVEPDGGDVAVTVTVSPSTSLVVNETELSCDTIHWCLSVPFPSTVRIGTLFAATIELQQHKVCILNKQWRSQNYVKGKVQAKATRDKCWTGIKFIFGKRYCPASWEILCFQ